MIQYRSLKNWKYQTTKAYRVRTGIKPPANIYTDFLELSVNGGLLVKEGYCWDGATWGIDTENFMRGSLLHDSLCQLIKDKKLDKSFRVQVDDFLHKILLEDGMSRMRAWLVRKGVGLYVKVKY